MIREDWVVRPLAEVAVVQGGMQVGRVVENASAVPYLRVANVKDGHLDLTVVKAMLASPADVERYALRSGDVLFTEGGDHDKLGRGCVWNGQIDPCLHQNHLFAVRPTPEVLLPEFLAMLASSALGRRYFQASSKASTNLASINSTQLKAFPVPLPPLAEQRRIIEILCTWDEAIENLSSTKARKLALLRATRNRLAARSSWDLIPLGDVFVERAEAADRGAMLLSVTQANGVIRHSAAGRKDSSSADRSKYKRVLPGDIAYNTMRMWQGASGVVFEEGIISPAYTVIVPDAARVDVRYASHLFKSERMMFNFERYSQGLTSDTWNLKFPAFSEIRVALPPLSEQQRRAELLDDMGSELKLIDSQLELLRTQKRGLMQKLLTGDVRITLDEEKADA